MVSMKIFSTRRLSFSLSFRLNFNEGFSQKTLYEIQCTEKTPVSETVARIFTEVVDARYGSEIRETFKEVDPRN